MNKITLEHIKNRNQYFIPKEVLLEFLKRPVEERIVTLRHPNSTDTSLFGSREDLMQRAGVGTLDSISDVGGELVAEITIDPLLPSGDILKKLLQGDVKMGFSFSGVGDVSSEDPDQIEFVDITHVAILPEPENLRG